MDASSYSFIVFLNFWSSLRATKIAFVRLAEITPIKPSNYRLSTFILFTCTSVKDILKLLYVSRIQNKSYGNKQAWQKVNNTALCKINYARKFQNFSK